MHYIQTLCLIALMLLCQRIRNICIYLYIFNQCLFFYKYDIFSSDTLINLKNNVSLYMIGDVMRLSLAEQIDFRMKQKNMTIRDLERAANTKPNAVRYILEGTSQRPSIYLVEDIAKALDCTIHDLLDDSSYEEKMLSNKVKSALGIFMQDMLEKDGYNEKNTSKDKEDRVSVENIELLKECLVFVIDHTDPNNINFKQIKNIAYETYLFSMVKNNKVLSEAFALWEIEKHID